MTPEGKVKALVRAALHRVGAYQFWPVQTGLGGTTIDCIACVPVKIKPMMIGTTIGVFVAIETKRGDKPAKVTARQAMTLQQVKDAFGETAVVTCAEDLPDVLRR